MNNSKRDRLPERELLRSRRDVIIEYWRALQGRYPSRFGNEYLWLTGSPFKENWHLALFSAVSEAVEIAALQRGVERWGG